MQAGIKYIEFYVPNKSISVLANKEKFKINDSFIKNKSGFESVTRKEKNQQASDLAFIATNEMLIKNEINKQEIDGLIFVTQNPDMHGIPHSSAILHKKLELKKDMFVFDISLGCTGFVAGLDIAKSLLQFDNFKNILLVTSDPYSNVIDENDKSTAILFGDGSCSALITKSNYVFEIHKSNFGIISEKNQAINVGPDNKLHMSGKDVFDFTASEIGKSIDKTIEINSLKIDEIDAIFLHQGSKYVVDTIKKKFAENIFVPFNSSAYGNTVSSSIGSILHENYENSDICNIIVSGFGVGLAWHTTLLKKMK
jgi:3-oxoacyl-[acyl-carrier-protein] synthase-3